jgi:hypothetical protein
MAFEFNSLNLVNIDQRVFISFLHEEGRR